VLYGTMLMNIIHRITIQDPHTSTKLEKKFVRKFIFSFCAHRSHNTLLMGCTESNDKFTAIFLIFNNCAN